jgi:PAS domain S-box-containing protein
MERGLEGSARRELDRLLRERDDARAAIAALIAGEIDAAADARTTSPVLLRDAQEALARRERLLAALFEGALDALLVADDRGRYVDVNPAACELLGRPKEQILGLTVADIAAPGPDFAAVWREFLSVGRMTGEYVVVRPDGVRRVAEFKATAHIEPGRHLSVLRDITERRRAEEALAASEARVRALVANSADAIKLVAPDGTILYASPSTERVLGYTDREHQGHNVFDFVHKGDVDALREAFATCLRRPGVPVRSEIRYRHKNGTFRVLEAIRVNRLDDPELGAIVTNYRDITDRKLLHEQLIQAQKMEAVGQLAGGVAHDFNNLLTGILSFSDLILADLPEGDPLRSDLEQIARAGRRAAALTGQLLAFSRKQVMRPRVVSLNDIITELQKMLRRLIGEDIELVTNLDGALGEVKVDPAQMEQVILNLVVNARDALRGRAGRVTIETGEVTLTEVDRRGPNEIAPGRYVRLRVVDTGIGMDEAVRARIFEPFFTTKAPGKGTGLGLSTVLGIVEQSGGRVAVTSEPGVGTTFDVFLPIAARVAEPGEDEAGDLASLAGHETILLVEDEEVVRNVGVRTLRRAGYNVLEASNGADALLIAAQHLASIHLLLTDVVMPTMGGVELAARLRAMRPDLRVLFMSGHTGERATRADLTREGNGLLDKPFSPTALLRAVRASLPAGPP